jgi:hypothetical protein
MTGTLLLMWFFATCALALFLAAWAVHALAMAWIDRDDRGLAWIGVTLFAILGALSLTLGLGAFDLACDWMRS